MATAYRWSGEIPQGLRNGRANAAPEETGTRRRFEQREIPRFARNDGEMPLSTNSGAVPSRKVAALTTRRGFCEDRRALSSSNVSSLSTTRSLRREVMVGNCKKPAVVEFYTVKRIDNSRLVRHVEPAKMRNLLRTAALGGIIAMFFMLYVYQHFRCIDMSFQLEDLKGKQAQAAELNGKLKLEIATLRDPHRIDVIAQHELGFTRPEANQIREYVNLDGAEVAALQYTRLNRAP